MLNTIEQMKIRQLGIVVVLLFVFIQSIAQSDIEDYVKEGVQYHDEGQYDKAIKAYKKALKIDSKSPLINAEIALSYFTKGDYKKAIKHCDVVIKHNKDYLMQAYMTKGSALDMLGKSKESIELFKKAIKKTEGHYLLYYNLALNYYKINELDNAEKNVIKVIETNPQHSSSHLMLANIHNQRGNTIQTLLAVHYFLFLEPKTQRSPEAYRLLRKKFRGNVSRDKDKSDSINISFSPNDTNQFAAAELMISMLEASKSLDKNKGKTDDEMFVENTGSFFKILGEMKEEKNNEIWWGFYTTFFYEIAKSDHLETYCMYITQSGNKNAKKWVAKNESKLNDFNEWLKNN